MKHHRVPCVLCALILAAVPAMLGAQEVRATATGAPAASTEWENRKVKEGRESVTEQERRRHDQALNAIQMVERYNATAQDIDQNIAAAFDAWNKKGTPENHALLLRENATGARRGVEAARDLARHAAVLASQAAGAKDLVRGEIAGFQRLAGETEAQRKALEREHTALDGDYVEVGVELERQGYLDSSEHLPPDLEDVLLELEEELASVSEGIDDFRNSEAFFTEVVRRLEGYLARYGANERLAIRLAAWAGRAEAACARRAKSLQDKIAAIQMLREHGASLELVKKAQEAIAETLARRPGGRTGDYARTVLPPAEHAPPADPPSDAAVKQRMRQRLEQERAAGAPVSRN